MKLSYRDSKDIRAPAEPGRAKTVIVATPPRSTVLHSSHYRRGNNGPMAEESTDPSLWPEDVLGEPQLNWVRARNDPTVAQFAGEEFERMRAETLEVLDTDARIPYVTRRGEYLYNFWRDATNPRGLWRRTTLASYRTDSPEWDVLIDVDELGRADDQKWVWGGANVLEPDLTRALIVLSPGGSDAAVWREFDMQAREFVAGGFELAEAKSQ